MYLKKRAVRIVCAAMAAMMFGRSTPLRCFNSASRAVKPSLVKGNLSIFFTPKKIAARKLLCRVRILKKS